MSTALDSPVHDRQVALIRYLHDCLSAQTEWAKNVNVLAQQDVHLVPLTRRQQQQLGEKSALSLASNDAVELGNRFTTGGSEYALRLGALFLIGRVPASGDRPARDYCAPLLEVPLKLTRNLQAGQIVVEPEDETFTVNFSLVGEVLRDKNDDFRDRMADLSDVVPDFPIDPTEFRDFWNGFCMVANRLPLAAELPRPRRKRGTQPSTASSAPVPGDDKVEAPDAASAPLGRQVDQSTPLEMVDFYLPQISKDGNFRLLPATTIILGKRSGHVFSALRELEAMTQQSLTNTGFSAVCGIDNPASVSQLDLAQNDLLAPSGTESPATAEVIDPDADSSPSLSEESPPDLDETQSVTTVPASDTESKPPAAGSDLVDDGLNLFDTNESQPHSLETLEPSAPLKKSDLDSTPADENDAASPGAERHAEGLIEPVLVQPRDNSPRNAKLELQDAFPLPLTQAQQEIVRSAREAPLTVATGPPGTGKSYTITAVVLDAMLRGQSVLIASQMDKAVQIVADQVEEIAGPYAIARSGGRAAQRQLADKITRLTGPQSRLKHRDHAERLDVVRKHGSLTDRLAKLEQRYQAAIEQEKTWNNSTAAFERLEPICPLPVHDITARDLRRARAAFRRVRATADHDSAPIRFPGQAPLKSYAQATQLCRLARDLLSGQPGIWSRIRAAWLKRKAVRLFEVKPPRRYSHQDVERSLRHWWKRWNHQRTLDALKVPASWESSLDDIDEALFVQGHKVAIESAERDLRGAFPIDLLWQEIEHLDGARTATALQLLTLNREATLYSLIHGGEKCQDCNGSGREECDKCFGAKRLGKCKRCGGDGLWGTNPCTTCDGTGICVCSKCRGKGNTKTRCAPCKGKGRIKVGRHHLRLFRTLLRRRDRKLKKELREQIDLDIPLRAFPAWACTNRSLGQVLPAKPGLFDLVILDEASQCDLATAAVALFRGKRALVVGDPQQLRHVSFLSRVREQASFTRHHLDVAFQERFRYRRSLFDIASDAVPQKNFFLLDQHFRSHPHIIDFSNRNFYDSQLRIMTERPHVQEQSAVRRLYTEGQRTTGSSVNPAEIDAIISEVGAVIQRTQGKRDAPSIGIVSPFRDHIDAIRERLIDRLPASDLERHQLVLGTAHALQGDEKDIIFFTTSVDTQSHSASLRFLENPNLFNVAITRARHELVTITSVTPDTLRPGLLREFLWHTERSMKPQPIGDDYETAFQRKVTAALRRQELVAWPNYQSAGVRIDLVVSDGTNHVALLLDGEDDAPHDVSALIAHRILVRAGWHVTHLSPRSWKTSWYDCLEHLRETLQS